MNKWRWFKDNEFGVAGLKDDVMFKLDRSREFYGFPIKITSGLRTVEEQEKINPGVKESAHLKGLAVDISAPQIPYMRERLIWALTLAGFQRIESCPYHFHVDVDHTKVTPCFWLGVDN